MGLVLVLHFALVEGLLGLLGFLGVLNVVIQSTTTSFALQAVALAVAIGAWLLVSCGGGGGAVCCGDDADTRGRTLLQARSTYFFWSALLHAGALVGWVIYEIKYGDLEPVTVDVNLEAFIARAFLLAMQLATFFALLTLLVSDARALARRRRRRGGVDGGEEN